MKNLLLWTISAVTIMTLWLPTHSVAQTSIEISYGTIESSLEPSLLNADLLNRMRADAREQDDHNKLRGLAFGGVFPAGFGPGGKDHGVLVVLLAADLLWDTRKWNRRDHGALFLVAIPLRLTLNEGKLGVAADDPQVADIHSWGGGAFGLSGLKNEGKVRQGVVDAVDKNLPKLINDRIRKTKEALDINTPISRIDLMSSGLKFTFGKPGNGDAVFNAYARDDLPGMSPIAQRSFCDDQDAVFRVTMLAENQFLRAMKGKPTIEEVKWALLDGGQGENQWAEEKRTPGQSRISLLVPAGFKCNRRGTDHLHIDNPLHHDQPKGEGRKWRNRANVVIVERGPAWNGHKLMVSKERNKGGPRFELEPGINMLELAPFGPINENLTDMWVE